MSTNTKYQIHVILLEVVNGDTYDIMYEDEPKEYKEEFETLEEAKEAYNKLTGQDI